MEKVLQKIVNRIVNLAEPEEIILFGSFAKGRNNIFSDLDLLVVTDCLSKRKETELQLISFIREYSLDSDLLIRTKAEKEKALDEPFSFLGSILREGKIIYKKGY